jgi:hypothetical protein
MIKTQQWTIHKKEWDKNIRTQLGHKLKNIIIYDQNTTVKIWQGQE